MATIAITSTGGNEKDEEDDDDNDDALFSALVKSLDDVNSNMATVQKRMRERAHECKAASKRRRCNSKLEDAEQMSLESSKFDARADELWKLYRSMEYETLLVRLILNDKDIRIVDDKYFSRGHGLRLGGALLHNTMVTDLEMDLDKFLLDDSGSEDSKEMELLLMFLDNNKSLLRFGVRVGDFGERDDSEYRKISSMLLNRLLKCQQLERLTWALPLSAVAFHRVMTTLASLRELDLVQVSEDEQHWYSDVQKRAIACAFQSNNTLQKLKLCIEDVDLFAAILIAVQENGTLRDLHLNSHGGEGHDYFEALVPYLHTTRALGRLEMEGFCMTEACMTILLRGLQRPSGTSGCGIPKATISSLYFTACYISDEACEQLATFLQTKTANSVGKPILESHLHTIHVSSDLDCFGWEGTDRTISEMMATSLLMAPSDASSSAKLRIRRPIFIPTIGSQIRCVSLEGVRRRFFQILRTHSHQGGHLHTLELTRLSRGAAMAFSKCLSKLVSLRKLKIDPWASSDGWDLNLIVDGLKQNGSILDVDTYDSGRSEFNSTQLRLIQAYEQRNRHLNVLLASDQGLVNADDSHHKDKNAAVDGPCEPGMDTMDDENKCSDGSNGNSSNSNNSRATSALAASDANLLVRPSLLQCTGQIPRTHTAMMIRGLSVLGQNIGY